MVLSYLPQAMRFAHSYHYLTFLILMRQHKCFIALWR
jgi:hypothetical protein